MFWSLTFNKSCSSYYVEETLFNGPELIQYLAWSNRAHETESSAVLKLRKSAKSGMTEIRDFRFHVPAFGDF
jgi:hypothetical protein